jgi:protein gp37
VGKRTGISWCDHTFNPWWGCQRVSEGCANCYAEATSKRWGFDIWGPGVERRLFGEKHWNEPLQWNREAVAAGVRRRVFTGSMCDVMEARQDLDPWRARLYGLVEATPGLDWLFCTHRPGEYWWRLPVKWTSDPRPNVWLLATVEDARHIPRIGELVDCPAVIRGLSLEPLLAPLDLREHLDLIDWVIVGGESGSKARLCESGWIRSIAAQCGDRGVACYVKQLGANSDLSTADFKGADPAEWPDDLRVREYPKDRRR